jgi:hypothetical protein
LNDTVVTLSLEVMVLPETDPPIAFWNVLLSEEAKRLAALLGKVDAYLGHKQLIAPRLGCSGARHGRPSILVDTLRVLDPQSCPDTRQLVHRDYRPMATCWRMGHRDPHRDLKRAFRLRRILNVTWKSALDERITDCPHTSVQIALPPSRQSVLRFVSVDAGPD